MQGVGTLDEIERRVGYCDVVALEMIDKRVNELSEIDADERPAETVNNSGNASEKNKYDVNPISELILEK